MEIPYSGAAELPEGVCGVIFRRDGRPFIAANKKDTLKRRIFTVDHEVGHYILQPLADEEEYRLDKYRYDDKNAEKGTEANYFAASLLVPK